MSKAEINLQGSLFSYTHKPSFVRTGLYCFISISIATTLFYWSEILSQEIRRQVLQEIDIAVDSIFYKLPYGVLIAGLFVCSALQKLLWHIMTVYEITADSISVLTGITVRGQYFYTVNEFDAISFRQNIAEAIFNSGTVLLTSSLSKRRLVLSGIYNPRAVVEALRPHLGKRRSVEDRQGSVNCSSSLGSPPRSTPQDSNRKTSVQPASSQRSQPSSSRPHAGRQADVQRPFPSDSTPSSSSQGFPVNRTEVTHKSGGCLGCLVILLIIILLPLVIGVVFKIAVITSLLGALGVFLEVARQFLSELNLP